MKKNIGNYIKNPIKLKHELSIILSARRKSVIFDIGACECEDSIRYKKAFPNSIIHSFEPLEKNYQKCLNNIKKFDADINVHKLALSDKEGVSIFHISSGNPEDGDTEEWDYGNKSSSLLEPDKTKANPWLKFEEKTEVQTSTIDLFCDKYNITTVDYIHMDVQGAEMLVLKGAEKMLPKIKSIWLEVSDEEFYKGQPIRLDIEAFMYKNGFFKVIDEVNVTGDQLYVNSRFFNNWIFNLKRNLKKLFVK